MNPLFWLMLLFQSIKLSSNNKLEFSHDLYVIFTSNCQNMIWFIFIFLLVIHLWEVESFFSLFHVKARQGFSLMRRIFWKGREILVESSPSFSLWCLHWRTYHIAPFSELCLLWEGPTFDHVLPSSLRYLLPEAVLHLVMLYFFCHNIIEDRIPKASMLP